MLNKEQILASSDLPMEEVSVPEWGGSVNVRSMTGADKDAFEQSLIDARGKSDKPTIAGVRARLLAWTIVDEAGARVFSDADIAALGGKSAKATDRVYEVASRLNSVTPNDVEKLAGNSDAAPSGSSTSDSPKP